MQVIKKRSNKSCGAIALTIGEKKQTKHNLCNSRQYHIWNGILQRCWNENIYAYKTMEGAAFPSAKSGTALKTFINGQWATDTRTV